MTNNKTNGRHPASAAEPIVEGRPLGEWEGHWTKVDGGFDRPHPELRHSVGLFRAVLRGEVKYIGVGTEHANGGLRKRIADFTRESSSAREHEGGEYIHEHSDKLELEVLTTGHDKQAGEIAKALKPHMLALHSPRKNVPAERVRSVVQAKARAARAAPSAGLKKAHLASTAKAQVSNGSARLH